MKKPSSQHTTYSGRDAGSSPPQGTWGSESWATAPPEDHGIDPKLIQEIHQDCVSGVYGYMDRFLLVRNGHLVVDKRYTQDYVKINQGKDKHSHPYNYFHPDWHPFYHGSELHTVQSITKSVTSVAIGVAMQRGEFPGLETRVMDIFEDFQIQNMDDSKRRITIEDLITMRSGFEWDESSSSYFEPPNSCYQMENSHDWIQFVLDLPMSHQPGEHFNYNSGGSQLISAIIKSTTGKYVHKYLEEHLFKPLDISTYYWKKTPTGYPDTEGGLYLLAEDLAKIGYLILRSGTWEGERILPQEWVVKSTTPMVEDVIPEARRDKWHYGYQWWIIEGDSDDLPMTIAASGFGNQYLCIVPELDLLGVLNAWNIYDLEPRVIEIFTDRIVSAVVRGSTSL
jgi:CubicO group peptidase (beta-lactamase class C family)